MSRALLAAAVLAAAPAGAAGVEGELGASATAGSGGYTRAAASLDLEAAKGSLRPFGWAELSRDDDARRASFGAGAWNDVDESLAVKGALGASFGRYEDSELDGRSLSLEGGAETYRGDAAFGGDYRLTVGSIADSRAAPRVAKEADVRGRGRKARGESAEGFHVHAWSGYARLPLGEGRIGLRVTLTKPSYSRAILSETVSWRVPVARDWRVTPAVTFEQGAERGVYGTLSLARLF